MIDLTIEQVTLIVLLVITATCFFWALYENQKRTELETNLKFTEKRCKQLQEENSALQRTNDHIRKEFVELQKTNEHFHNEFRDSQQTNNRLRVQLMELQEHYDEAVKANILPELIDEITIMENSLAEQKKTIQVLHGRIGGLTKQNNKLRKNG